MSKTQNEVYHVLVADDSEVDRALIRAAMRRASRLSLTAELPNGEAVLQYFSGREPYHNRRKFPIPDLLLLDLKMPVMDGFEVLEWMAAQAFDRVMVVVLTDSMNPEHIKRALELGADMFQVKPHDNPDREAMILALEEHLRSRAVPMPVHGGASSKKFLV